MKLIAKLALTLALGLGLAGVVQAGEQTLSGDIVCAKCALKKADATGCQNVLIVKDGDTSTEYYLAKTPAAEKLGHVCMNKKAATITGAVSEKDGKKWLAASKIEEKKSQS